MVHSVFYVFDGEKYSFIIYLFIFFRLFKRSYFIAVLSVGMPSIRPLETLHNALSLRQLDAFLEYVTATIFKTPCPSPRLRSPLAEKRSLRGIFGDSSSSKPPSLSQSSRQSSKYFTIFFVKYYLIQGLRLKGPIAPVFFVVEFQGFDKSTFFESVLLSGAYKLVPIFLRRVM